MITGFARVEIAAGEPDREAQTWTKFLGAPPTGVTFTLANIDVSVRRCAEDEAPGLARLVFTVDDVGAAVRLLERRGLRAEPRDGEAILAPEATGGVRIGLTASPERTTSKAAADAISGLDHVVIRVGETERAVATYGARLGLDLRLDRSNPAWGARLLFFRCGDAVVEMSAPLDHARADRRDVLGGLAFRALDPDATRSRLAANGFDVSDVRAGRKPGTRVFTLRSGLACGPALVLSASSGE